MTAQSRLAADRYPALSRNQNPQRVAQRRVEHPTRLITRHYPVPGRKHTFCFAISEARQATPSRTDVPDPDHVPIMCHPDFAQLATTVRQRHRGYHPARKDSAPWVLRSPKLPAASKPNSWARNDVGNTGRGRSSEHCVGWLYAVANPADGMLVTSKRQVRSVHSG